MILCVAANPSIDKLFGVDRLEPGRIHRPSDFTQVAGGKGLNAARAAVALGGSVLAAALLGGHAGRWVAEQLEREGVELHAAWSQAETRSSLSVSSPGEGLTEFYERGGPVTEDEWSRFMDVTAPLVASADWVAVSGSLPAGAPGDGYLPVLAAGRVAFDSREAGVEALPALVKLNAAEAAALTGRPVADAAGAAAAARALHEATGGGAIVTLGSEGAVSVSPDGRGVAARVSEHGRYPVGSGDAFLAGMVVALDGGAGWDDALAAAVGAGSANAEVPGAGVLDPARARELTSRARLSEV